MTSGLQGNGKVAGNQDFSDLISFFSRARNCFGVIGGLSILLGLGDLAAGVIAFLNLSSLSVVVSWAWAGCAFAIIDGAVALRAAFMLPRVSERWSHVLLYLGIATVVFYAVDCALALVGAVFCTHYMYNPSITCTEVNQTDSCEVIEGGNPAAVGSEWARFAITSMLIVAISLQMSMAIRVRSKYREDFQDRIEKLDEQCEKAMPVFTLEVKPPNEPLPSVSKFHYFATGKTPNASVHTIPARIF